LLTILGVNLYPALHESRKPRRMQSYVAYILQGNQELMTITSFTSFTKISDIITLLLC